jgi:formylglycine-generating enzyme required for sulfatase activity
MSDFYKKFLMEDVPRVTAGTNKQIFLGAFGKHPGWDDHVEDLGLETSSLISAKVLFYIQGIGGEIDAGAWEKLDETQRVPAFNHVFVWHRPGQVLIGRLWSSSDGKGRTRYPMVVCAHCSGVSLGWALDQVLPRLEQIERACLATQSAAEVRSILGRYRAELRNVASGQMTDLGPPSLDTAFLTRFAARPELGPQQEGWMRTFYAVQNQFGAFARGRFNPKADASTIRPQQIRVPRAADSIPKSILQWCNFFLTQVDPQTPLLLTLPLEEQWVDVTAGEPTSQEVFCLRASPKSMPLASEVPYNLSEDFRERVRGLLAVLDTGRPPGSILAAEAAAPAAAGPSAPRSKLLKWFGGGAALVLVAGAATWFASNQNQNRSPLPADNLPSASAPSMVVATPPPTGTEPAAAISSSPVTPAPATQPTQVTPPAQVDSALALRAAEEKRVAEEKAKAEAAARLKGLADERERIRLAAEAESKRLAEEKRAAEEKAKLEQMARLNNEVKPPSALPVAATSSSRPPPSGRVERTNLVGMVFVQIGGYWVGKFEVTQAEYEKVMSRNPSSFKDPARPVESVNWGDAAEFCQKLTNLETAAGRLQRGWTYSLPTEAQWAEFVADAELDGAISSYQREKRTSPEPVGSVRGNQFGLHDVRGNVWEWCLGPNEQKVLRGGGYEAFTTTGLAPTLSVPYRWTVQPDVRKPQAGFRCVLVKPS